MISPQVIILQQQMYVAHGAFYDAIAAYRAVKCSPQPSAEKLFQARATCQIAGERFDQAISRLLHHLQGLLRSEEGEVIVAQAQDFRDQLRATSNQLARSEV